MRRSRILTGVLLASAVVGVLSACGVHPVASRAVAMPTSVPATTVVAAPTTTVYVPPPATHTVYVQPAPTHTVYVQPASPATGQWYAQQAWIADQPWITITPAAGQTPCQWLHANGFVYSQAFAAWAQNDYPASWSATNDGYPCQRSYGMQH
jgi:hypothetical protein